MESRVSTISGRDTTQSVGFSRISGNSSGLASPVNINSLSVQTDRLNNALNNSQTSISGSISSELSTLRKELTRLEARDKEYHEAQEED